MGVTSRAGTASPFPEHYFIPDWGSCCSIYLVMTLIIIQMLDSMRCEDVIRKRLSTLPVLLLLLPNTDHHQRVDYYFIKSSIYRF